MEQTKKRDWGLIVVGIILILCGISFIVMPLITLVSLTALLGAALLVSGIINLVSYIRFHKTMALSGWVLAYTIIDIIIGLVFLLEPVLFSSFFPLIIGVAFLLFGIFEIAGAIKLRGQGLTSWGWTLVSGILTALFGVLLFIFPASLAILLGIFVVMRGFSLIVFGSTVENFLD